MLTHFIAFFTGGFFGVTVMCLCFAAGEEDRRSGEPRYAESCQRHDSSACVPQQSCGTNNGCYDEKGM